MAHAWENLKKGDILQSLSNVTSAAVMTGKMLAEKSGLKKVYGIEETPLS